MTEEKLLRLSATSVCQEMRTVIEIFNFFLLTFEIIYIFSQGMTGSISNERLLAK